MTALARYFAIAMLFGSIAGFGRFLVEAAPATISNSRGGVAKVAERQLREYRDGALTVLSKINLADAPSEGVAVIRVVDGDTLIVRRGGSDFRVRIIGVDTPESVKPRSSRECFGVRAADFTKRQLAGRRVGLRYDAERVDRYGRTLAYVDVAGSDFGADLLARGYARSLSISPNTSRADRYSSIEQQARAARRGLWRYCK